MANANYDSSNYDAAKRKYDELASKYEGMSGISMAQKQGSNIAETAGKSAVASSTAAGRSAGANKAQSMLAGMGSGSKAASENYATAVNAALNKQQNELSNAQNMAKTASDIDKAKYEGKIKDMTGKAGALSSLASGAAGIIGAAIASDETLKQLYPDMGDDVLEAFRNIRSCEYDYTKEANKAKENETLPGVDENHHTGVAAQDIKQEFPEAVIENEKGHLLVDTKELTMINAAAIAELSRQLQEIKAAINKGE